MNELDKIEKMIKQLRLEVAQKKSLFEAKNAEFIRLREQLDGYKKSKSILDTTNEPYSSEKTDYSTKIQINTSGSEVPNEINSAMKNTMPRSQPTESAYPDQSSALNRTSSSVKFKNENNSFIEKPPAKGGCSIF